MAKDPVCGMEIEPGNAAATAEYQGHTYVFCSPMCKTKFEQNPNKYLGQEQGGQAHPGHRG